MLRVGEERARRFRLSGEASFLSFPSNRQLLRLHFLSFVSSSTFLVYLALYSDSLADFHPPSCSTEVVLAPFESSQNKGARPQLSLLLLKSLSNVRSSSSSGPKHTSSSLYVACLIAVKTSRANLPIPSSFFQPSTDLSLLPLPSPSLNQPCPPPTLLPLPLLLPPRLLLPNLLKRRKELPSHPRRSPPVPSLTRRPKRQLVELKRSPPDLKAPTTLLQEDLLLDQEPPSTEEPLEEVLQEE